MATKIQSNTPIDIVINGTTVFTANSSGIIVTGSFNSSSPVTSASYAETASYALNGGGATINTSSFATTGSNNFNGNQTITGDVTITGHLMVGDEIKGIQGQIIAIAQANYTI